MVWMYVSVFVFNSFLCYPFFGHFYKVLLIFVGVLTILIAGFFNGDECVIIMMKISISQFYL